MLKRERNRRVTFPAARPRTVLQPLRVHVLRRNAGDRVRREIRQDGGYRRLDDERDEKQEGEDRENRRGAQADGSVKLGLLDYGAYLGLLHLNAHNHRRFVRINDCGCLWVTRTLLAIYSKSFSENACSRESRGRSGLVRRDCGSLTTP